MTTAKETFDALKSKNDSQHLTFEDENIFSKYDMSDDGIVTIKDVWLKKVWEITRPMKDWSINLQVKQNVVHKIRPGVWYSDNPRDFYMFKSKV